MKKFLTLFIISIVIAGGIYLISHFKFLIPYTQTPTPESQSPGPKSKGEGLIRLDDRAIKSAGIVIEEIRKREINDYITTTGEVKANFEKEAYITSRMHGKVIEVKVRLGENVGKGEVLAMIDSVDVHQMIGNLIGAGAHLKVAEVNLQRERALYGSKAKILDMIKSPPFLKGGEGGITSEEAMGFLKDTELGKAKAEILKPLTRFELTESNLKREKELYQDNISSMKEVIASEKEYTSAKIEFQTAVEEMFLNAKKEIAKAEAEYITAKAEVEKLRGSLHLYGFSDKDINRMIDESRMPAHALIPIISPFNGRITERMVTVGEVIDTSTKLFKLTDLSTVWIWANIYEKDLGKVKIGQEVSITVTPYQDKVFTGSITYIADTIDPATRTVRVRAELENPDRILKPEMFATVKILSDRKDYLPAIPETAVQREGDNTIVFVANPPESLQTPLLKRGAGGDFEKGERRIFEKRVVSVGPEVDGYHQVISGLKEGERIVTKGSFILKSESLKGLMEGE
ncbi:MAG: efflux RND transporter periplasmic adaptor subunit [Nitrospinae bacterium]|nr:efflux RND transporter periplasmic adaptor subunit [Nitrospinota bacterium]